MKGCEGMRGLNALACKRLAKVGVAASGGNGRVRQAAVAVIVGSMLLLVFAADGLASSTHGSTYIYWTNYGVSGTGGAIGRADLNGTHAKRSFITGAAGPVGVTVHGDYVYWSNPGVEAASPGTTIGRAKLNGTDVDQSFITGADSAHSLVIKGRYIYWDSRLGDTIGRADLNGTHVNQSFITGATAPAGVAVNGGDIYWSNFGGPQGGRVNDRPRLDERHTREPELHHRRSNTRRPVHRH
jgi:virginiamycin B lyase